MVSKSVIFRVVIITLLLLILNMTILAQQRRFGLEDTSKNGAATTEINPRRYLPTEYNRRFGLKPGESQLETVEEKIEEKIDKKSSTKNKKSFLKTAQFLVAKGDLEKAIFNYQKAINAKERIDLAHFGLGYTLIKLSRFDEAINSFKEVVKIFPENAKAHLNLGVALYSIGEIDHAIESYKKAIDLSKGLLPDAEFNLAFALYHQGDFPEAINYYQIAIKQRKIYPAAFNNLGLAYEAIGDFENANANFQLAIKQKQSNYPLAHYNLGRSYFNQGKFFPDAVTQLQIALEQQKNFPEALLILGNIYLLYENKGAIGSVEKAKTYYQKAILLKQNYLLAHQNLAIAHTKLGEKKEALAQYRKAFNLDVNSPFLLENLLFTITGTGSFFIRDEFSRDEGLDNPKLDKEKLHDSKEVVKALIEKYEDLPDELKNASDIRYCFAKVYMFLGDHNKAVDELQEALKLSKGEDKEAANLLSFIYKLIL